MDQIKHWCQELSFLIHLSSFPITQNSFWNGESPGHTHWHTHNNNFSGAEYFAQTLNMCKLYSGSGKAEHVMSDAARVWGPRGEADIFRSCSSLSRIIQVSMSSLPTWPCLKPDHDTPSKVKYLSLIWLDNNITEPSSICHHSCCCWSGCRWSWPWPCRTWPASGRRRGRRACSPSPGDKELSARVTIRVSQSEVRSRDQAQPMRGRVITQTTNQKHT